MRWDGKRRHAGQGGSGLFDFTGISESRSITFNYYHFFLPAILFLQRGGCGNVSLCPGWKGGNEEAAGPGLWG